MSKIEDGGYAFPCGPDDKAGWSAEYGMSLRDWFASQVEVPDEMSIQYAEVLAGREQPHKTGTVGLADSEATLEVIKFWAEVDARWRYDLMNLIEATPNLIWLLLTKRIGNVVKMTDPAKGCRMLPRNAAIGATIANEEEYERDNGKLWAVKQSLEPLFTFGSFEPLLGKVTLDKYAPDWIITGGETDQGAHKARHTDPELFRHLRNSASHFGRKFFMKQMTNKAPIPDDLMIREWPEIAR